jgi:hypothetical protein
VKALTTNIPVNRMARQHEGNAEKYVVVGSVTEAWVEVKL